MTQNKKKGIAKKALSISLVAAMLATSNVPVWASGFEAVDPAAEGFAVEEAAPVETVESAEDTPVVAATDIYDFSKVKPVEKYTWGNNVAFFTDDSVIKKSDGTPLEAGKVKFDVLLDGVVISGPHEATWVAGAFETFDKEAIGQTASLRFYPADDRESTLAQYDFVIEAKDINDANLAISGPNGQWYTGKIEERYPTVSGTVEGAAITADSFDWNFSAPSVKAGTTVTVTGTLKDSVSKETGYAGSIVKTYTIEPMPLTNVWDFVDITLNTTNAGEYTGNVIKLDPSAVTVKFKDTDVTLPVKEVVTDETPTPGINGEKQVKITLDDEALLKTENFSGASAQGTSSSDQKVAVSALNLNGVTIEPVTRKVGDSLNIALADLTIKNANGAVVNLTPADVDVTLANASAAATEYATPGVYQNVITVTAKTVAAGQTAKVTGSKSGNLVIVEKAFTNPTFAGVDFKYLADTKAEADSNPNIPMYNGKAIEFTALGDFRPDNAGAHDQKGFTFTYANNTNATGKNEYATLTVTGKAGTDYANCSKTFYFKIAPAEVETVDDSKNSNVTTAVSKELKGVEVKDAASAADYKDDIKLAISAISENLIDGKAPVFAMTEGTDYTTEYSYVDANGNKIAEGEEENEAGNKVKVVATLKNGNYAVGSDVTSASLGNGVTATTNTTKGTITVYIPIVAKTIEGAVVTFDKDSYVYTSKNIVPEVTVTYNGKTLVEDKDYSVAVTNGINAGTATVTITALAGNTAGLRAGSKTTKDFTITKANAADVIVKVADNLKYTGTQVTDPNFTATLSGNNVKGQFIVKWGENINAGKTAGKLTLTPSKKYAGNYEGIKEVEFEIKGKDLEGTLKAYDELGDPIDFDKKLTYTGSAHTFAKVVFTPTNPTNVKLVEGKDYEISYVDNTDAGTAYVIVTGKGNYAAKNTDNDFTAADGTKIENVVAKEAFTIKGTKLLPKHITSVENGVYAGGLVVKPEVVVTVNGKTLVEGKDYKLEYDADKAINATEKGKEIPFTVVGLGGYDGEVVTNANGKALSFGIDKFDLANANVTVKNGEVTVKNGEVTVPATEYTVTESEDGTYTIKASASSKNYTGEFVYESNKPESTVLSVTNRTDSTVTVAWDEVEGAEGYTIWYRSEYDTEMSRHIIKGGDVTSWTRKGLQPGTKYFFAMRSWVKDPEGSYVFSEVSPTQRGTTKPMAAKITSVTADANGNVKVRLAGEAAGAEMYSMCYSESANGFTNNDFKVGIRTSYTTRTFKEALEAGTYYVRVKSYRDLGNNKRVYGEWSNSMKVVVK